MSAYKKFLIQQQTYNGTTYTNVGNVVDTMSSFNVVCKEFPFKVLPEAKEPPKRDWADEDGEDVFFSAGAIKAKAYDVEATFLYAGTKAQMPTDLKNFIKFINGRNTGGSQCLKIYDEYTKTGRQGVYVQQVSDDLYYFNDSSVDAIAMFKVKFRVTDPVTDVTLTPPSN